LHQVPGDHSNTGEDAKAEVLIDRHSSEWVKFLQFLGPGILVAAVYVSASLPNGSRRFPNGSRRKFRFLYDLSCVTSTHM
jgi:hypothetical protein